MTSKEKEKGEKRGEKVIAQRVITLQSVPPSAGGLLKRRKAAAVGGTDTRRRVYPEEGGGKKRFAIACVACNR